MLSGVGIYLVLSFARSEGFRTGRLVKLSQKGLVLRTYEGTLDLGSGDRLTWDFSIHQDTIGDELINHTGEIVRLNYKEHLFRLFYETKYNVFSWETVHSEQSYDLLCRLVKILKSDVLLVEKIRPLIQEQDSDLLVAVRKCQQVINSSK